jgi:hypothetical protein
MSSTAVKLVDQRGVVLATGQASDEGAYFGGTLDLSAMPQDVRRLFEEFEELVVDQIFSLVDDAQDRAVRGLSIVLENGQTIQPHDLQIFPSTGGFSFRMVDASANGAMQKRI